MKKAAHILATAAAMLLGGLVYIAYFHAMMTGPTWFSLLLFGGPIAGFLLIAAFTVWRYPGHFFRS